MTSPRTLRSAAYGSALLGVGYAAVSAYWALGGTALLSTVGGQLEELARRGGTRAAPLATVVTVAKLAGAALSRTRG